MEQLWKRWLREYLLTLRSVHSRKPSKINSIKKGDVVIIHEDNAPRLFWKTGVVSECVQSKDGIVRACKIKIPNGSQLFRPVQKLYPLELATSGPGV